MKSSEITFLPDSLLVCYQVMFTDYPDIVSVFQLQKMLSRLIYETIPKLHLHGRPTSIMQVNDGVGLEPRLIAVMEHVAIQRARIHSQVVDTQRFEQQTERLEILEQTSRRYARSWALCGQGSATRS